MQFQRLGAIVALATAGPVVVSPVAPVAAQNPEQPITLDIPFGAGGSHDLFSRVITSILPTDFDQAVIMRLTPSAGTQNDTQDGAKRRLPHCLPSKRHGYMEKLNGSHD